MQGTYALEFYFLSTVGSVYGVFSHFSLFIYYDDNDNDDNFCLLQMKMNKEAVRFSSLERISFLGGRVVKTPCECIFWISFMYISSLAVEMNNTYIVLRLSFSFFVSKNQFELHMLSLLALAVCLRELLLEDNLKHWL